MRHLAFGYGMHYCLGALLGRLEGQIAMHMLLQRLPHMRLQTETVEWQPYIVTRGPQTLPVRFRP
jgi:cytochrome P450